MSGPLHGIRVVDMTRALAGPYATLMLADAGADVLKIERPGAGDDTRGWGPPFLQPDDGGPPQSTYYLSVNRNKRSVALDLKDPDDLQRLHRLIAEADVLVENFRPGVMERMGLGPAELERMNERLVVLSITGFGEGGPQGHRPGFDQIVQGEGGLMSFTGPEGGPPTKAGMPISDILAGMFGAYGVAAALVDRERTGRGQRVTTSLLASSVAVHTFQGTRWLLGNHVPMPEGNRHPSITPYGAYEVADGMIIVAVGSEGLWRKFAPLVDVDPDDTRFATNGDRVTNREELDAAMAPALTADTVDVWIERLDAAGVPAGRVRSLDEVYANPQIAHLGMIDEVDHPTLGTLRLPGHPVRFSRSKRDDPRPPPLLDEHSDDWLV
jgi:crotonobetainyl-CoA:carnitine CoA-transferase CaiB-like acyl-CoA transferase